MPKRVAVLMYNRSGYARGVCRGVAQYARSGEPWEFFLWASDEAALGLRNPGRFDGVIGFLGTGKLASTFRRAHTAAVTIGSEAPQLDVRRVAADDLAIGRLAAEHFLGRGLRHFALVGLADNEPFALRSRGFTTRLRQAGFDCAASEPWPYYSWTWDQAVAALGRWVEDLPTGCGVLAFNDDMAWIVAEACRHVDRHVPDEIAVLGVDNDEMICDFAPLPLSSVDPACERIGYEAAAMLDRLMSGRHVSDEPILIAPAGVVARKSTDVIGYEDPVVVAAVRFIRDFAHERIRVDDVAAAAGASRRSLQRRFKPAVGRTMEAEILHSRIERGRRVLLDTDLALPDVALRCGFEYGYHFARVFRKLTGQSPTEFRRSFRHVSRTVRDDEA